MVSQRLYILFVGVLLLTGKPQIFSQKTLKLASKGKAYFNISTGNTTDQTVIFAGAELKRYLDRISGATFKITSDSGAQTILLSILNNRESLASSNSFNISSGRKKITITASDESSILYAVYGFLNQLGCQWVAPAFEFYDGRQEQIPRQSELTYTRNSNGTVIQAPGFKYRKLYIEEGLTHNIVNLLQLIDWMPKARYNVLVAPIDYQGHGKVRWDRWRERLVPELKKRGIHIEVGGHGYQNFINESMESGSLFSKHPDWFGMTASGERSSQKKMVFCTSNPRAVAYVHNNILDYLRKRPEINIFDFWPPDSEEWCHCPDCKILGSASTRHALLINQTASFLKSNLPRVKLECLAYSHYTAPPESNVELVPDVLVDFCPIRQSFDFQIYDEKSEINTFYNNNLKSWRTSFKGDISLYSYYRKYAWRSLPVIIPHYMQNDLQYYRDIGINGISIYSEPGDWFTYGLNHYVLAALAWNPDVLVDSLINQYCSVVFGSAGKVATVAFGELERTVRHSGYIPNNVKKSATEYDYYYERLTRHLIALDSSSRLFKTESAEFKNLKKITMLFNYAIHSTKRQKYMVTDSSEYARKELDAIQKLAIEGSKEGLFIPR